MRLLRAGLFFVLPVLIVATAWADRVGAPVEVERLVFLRHGERPYGGMGQITPQGLLRALALPDVLLGKFGRPDFIFAPSPLEKVKELDTGRHYYYLRPIVTIEPTAIRCELPVNVGIGYTEIGRLRRELSREKYWKATVFVAWEHVEIVKVVREFLQEYGADPAQVPKWGDQDYDSIYILTITRKGGKVVDIQFTRDHEGLNGVTAAQVRLRGKR